MGISDDGKLSYNLDYRSKNDDAWYTSGVVLEKGNRLRVKFEGFESSYDEVFSIDDFSAHHEIKEFLRRFRPVSVPVEVNECSRVIQGTMVCATYTSDGSIRYFDAIIDAVNHKEHNLDKCLCTYLLFWQHGPEDGNITAASIDDICHIMSGPLPPKITYFVKLVREKLTATPFLSQKTSSNQTLNKLQNFNGDEDSSSLGFSEGFEAIDQDREMGGVKETGSNHYIILENLENNISPVVMTEFIHEQTSIEPLVHVYESLSTESYTRGLIIVDTKQKLKRIYEFISNPNHFIVSKLSGRPWVIAENMLRAGTFNRNMHFLQPKSEKKITGGKLMVVRLGTEEYKRAKISKDLYMEYRTHINGLAKRLNMEEMKKWRTLTAN